MSRLPLDPEHRAATEVPPEHTTEGDEACEAAINMTERAIASLGLVPQHRRIVDAERSLQIAKSRLEDYLGR